MSILKYISTFIIILTLAFPSYAISKDSGRKDPNKKTTFVKKGNFVKDESFNPKNTRFGPPDPGGGGGGNPVPVNPSYGLLLIAGISFSFYLYKKRKVTS